MSTNKLVEYNLPCMTYLYMVAEKRRLQHWEINLDLDRQRQTDTHTDREIDTEADTPKRQ